MKSLPQSNSSFTWFYMCGKYTQHPKQDERYRRMRALLAADPEWHDGEIIWSESA